jgi:Bacterial Ig-like domain
MAGPTTVTLSIDNTDLNLAHGTATVTFTFSAPPPLGFTLDDTSAVGGTLSNLSQLNATTYIATFTAAANTDIANASVSVAQTSPVPLSSAVATFYEVQNNWAPSQMIDGIFTGPPPGPGQGADFGGVNGWSVYDFSVNPNMAEGADALLTIASPLPAGQYNLTFKLYQNYYGNPGHLLGDFALAYTTAASPTLSTPQTRVSIQGESSLTGTTFSLLSPGELLATSHSIGTDTYIISASIDSASPITGIFLDAIKNPTLPGGGPGNFDNGNFVVSEFTLDTSLVGSTAFTVDTIVPTVAVSIDNPFINKAHNTGTVTFTFSEAPTAFTLPDTTAVGGRLSNLTGSGKSYTATFTGAAETLMFGFVSVTTGSWQENNGNPGAGGSTAVFQIDTRTPAPPPAGTTADLILRGANSAPTVAGQYEIYDIGNNAILAGYSLGQVGTDWQFASLGRFFGSDTTDMLLRSASTGGFEVYDISNNNITGAAFIGTVGMDWQAAGFGNLSSLGETDILLRNVNTGGLEVYDIHNNQITNAAFMGTIGLNWQFSGVGNFSSRGTSDLLLRNSNTGGLEAYDIANNQITNAAFIGTVGLDWQFSGVGNFSGVPGETDLLLRNNTTGGLVVYDISNNQLTGDAFIGTIGLEWQYAGIAPVHAAGASDLVLRNVNSGPLRCTILRATRLSEPLPWVRLAWIGSWAASPLIRPPLTRMASASSCKRWLVSAPAQRPTLRIPSLSVPIRHSSRF